MASLAILIPLYPSLCVFFSSLLMIYLYRRGLRRVCLRFIFWKNRSRNQNQKQGRYTRLDDREVELESGLESENEFEIQPEELDDDKNEDGDEAGEDEDDEKPSPFPEPNPQEQPPPPTPLAIYFNAQTTLIHPQLLSPAAPPTPGWERQLRRRIDEGRGLGAWKDRLVERTVRWLLSFS
ncbi:uncharacterized protein KD926_008803 [Aspergillus affinis]|uniref:uncharacterized protein n=1 Tax=Aspergillus affinis TaxID=1070780 RepID=UPI0022FE4A83|nr:uncharacterized protein KD926_008803 [Aspergillus affinis]KAI9045376.1 hypothetical protein KD926_008803 [Aspergillus affinis]